MDERAIDAWVEGSLAPLRRFVRRRTGPLVRSKEPCSDIVQSVVREAYEARAPRAWADEGEFRRWLLATAARKIVSKSRYHAALRRDRGREEPLPSSDERIAADGEREADASPPGRIELEEDLARLQRAIEALEELDREVLVARKILGLTPAETSARLGLAESTVRWRLARAMERLATVLG